MYCGLGEPEGVQTSVVAGVYLQTDRAASSHPWFAKRTGTGNTGWRGWAGLRGSALGSFEIGDNALANARGAIAIGDAGNVANGAKATGIQSISLGDGNARDQNSIVIGWSHETTAAMAHPNFVFGFGNIISTSADVNSPDPATRGGHIMIAENGLIEMGPTAFPNIIIGRDSKGRGRAVYTFGQGAEGRALNTPTTGLSEAHFALIGGYLAKGNGGCIVAWGDQADVRGDFTLAVGTHTRANDNNTSAVGPQAFAGSTGNDGTGQLAVAMGVNAQSLKTYGLAVGSDTLVSAILGTAVGPQAKVNTLHDGAMSLGYAAQSKRPFSLMIGGSWANGFLPITEICFNGSNQPAFLVGVDGTIQINDTSGPVTSWKLPVTVNVTLNALDSYMATDATAGLRTITMAPTAGVTAGHRVWVIKDDASANVVRILPSGADTIDGGASFDLTARYKWALFRRSGTNWVLDDNN